VVPADVDQEDLESTCCADVEKRIRDPGIANIAGSKNRKDLDGAVLLSALAGLGTLTYYAIPCY
jgi:hypothetical protein